MRFDWTQIILSAVLSVSTALAQDNPKAPAETLKREAEKPETGTPAKPVTSESGSPGFSGGRATAHYSQEASVDRRLAAFSRLRELTFETIRFEPEKRRKLERMFDDYMGGLLVSNHVAHIKPKKEDAATPQQLPRLQKELEEAEKSGADAERILTLKTRVLAAKIALEPSILDEPVFFFDYIREEMSESEQKQFEPILTRWRMLRVPDIAPDNDFKQLRRSSRDPLLRDSEELGKKLDDIIVEAFRTVPLGPDRVNPSVMAELAVRTKPKILEILNSDQRDHFEKTLAMLKKWNEEDPALARKERERLKDHKPSRAAELTSPPRSENEPPKP